MAGEKNKKIQKIQPVRLSLGGGGLILSKKFDRFLF
jgi:hypothetical protein